MSALEKFLRYVTYDTQSEEGVDVIPSTKKQFVLANLLADELRSMGAEHVEVTDQAYVYASIPSNIEKKCPVIGFISHIDTADAYSGTNVIPKIVKNYDGNDIVMNQETGLTMYVHDFPDLLKYKGQDLIMTDGSTLLGADDKAGVAEIMAMAEYFLTHPEEKHGEIKIAFTPDEEVGKGANGFDLKRFGADAAYTVDGGALGEIEYENFNAASAKVKVHGSSIHPGSAKNKMKNAILMSMEFENMLPACEKPQYTEGYEGFYHLSDFGGDVESAMMSYIIRDHDKEKFEAKKQNMKKIADYLNSKYGDGSYELEIKDSYYNMKEKIEPHMYLIDIAKTAMSKLNIVPETTPIRGGTDGARLSYMGLPCPNLCTGGYNFHGKYEFIPADSIDKVTKLLIKIAEIICEK